MPFNGSGSFVRVYNWVNDANASVNITASRFDTEDSGFATGLSNCITKDGQQTVTQNIPWNNKKITGLGAGTGATDAAQIGQVQSGQLNWVAAAGTADALTAVYSPVNTALSDGLLLFTRAGAANATTTPTFAPDGLTAHTITKSGGVALAAGDIVGAGHELELRYNLANTRWELLNPGVVPQTPVTDATIATTDVTTNNASTSKHGWLKKLSNVATQYMGGDGNWTALPATPSTPTQQILTSGSSATYTTPTGCRMIKVRETGAGGGGAGCGSSTSPTGATGGTTTFNSITALGGTGGSGTNIGQGGAGGTGGTGSGFRLAGVAGQSGAAQGQTYGTSGNGGGNGGGIGTNSGAGGNAIANSSGGGAGAYAFGSSQYPAGGGGSGEYAEFQIASPAGTYTYTVGAGGAGGVGTGGAALSGGAGGSGVIIIDEYY